MEPRYYQQAAHDAAWRYLAQSTGNPVVVLPTGAGKSLLAAMLVRQAFAFSARVLVLQHRKELIRQNAEKIGILLPGVSVGINSAGLRRHAFDDDVICCGIQTVYKRSLDFGRRELVIVDEAHLIGTDSETMYGRFLNDLREVNQKLRVIGLTATPYRTGEGPICGSEKLFNKICYEVFTGDLIQQGYLCPLTNRAADATVDTSGLKLRGGEFISSDMEREFIKGDNIRSACAEIVAKCMDRRSVLLFCAGVIHAEAVAEVVEELTGEPVGVVTGETFPMERDRILSDFRCGRLRWCVNVDVLTTGFDSPRIDAIGVLRATMSPGLFAQIVGRGLRKHDDKSDCLILDFGGNIARHGSLDDPNYGRSSGRGSGSGNHAAENNGRGKQCPQCKSDAAPRSAVCPECGYWFPPNHESTSDENSTITGSPPDEVWRVEATEWRRHNKKNNPDAPPTLRVDYACQPAGNEGGNLSGKIISEWVCIEHDGYAWSKAAGWWDARSLHEMPSTVDAAVELLNRGVCRMPVQITTTREGKYYRIKSVEFLEEKPPEDEWLPEREQTETYEFSGFDTDVPF